MLLIIGLILTFISFKKLDNKITKDIKQKQFAMSQIHYNNKIKIAELTTVPIFRELDN